MKLNTLIIMVLACVVTVGCKKKVASYDDEMTPEQTSVYDYIDSLSDVASVQSAFKKEFTKAPSASEMKKFKEYKIVPLSVEVSGSTATANVSIEKYGESNENAPQKTWKFVKDGEGWKIEDAPMP
ncbi:hypothetical protein ACFL2H_03405 [Planctomycetota bacterium]